MLFRLVLLAAITVAFYQVCDAKAVAEDVKGLSQITENAYVRNVEGKVERIMENNVRRTMISRKGFWNTVGTESFYILKTPFEWVYQLILFPFHFFKNIFYYWDLQKTKTAKI